MRSRTELAEAKKWRRSKSRVVGHLGEGCCRELLCFVMPWSIVDELVREALQLWFKLSCKEGNCHFDLFDLQARHSRSGLS